MSTRRPRVAFFGSPEYAVPSLDALNEIADVVVVVAQPDKKAGRGMKLRPPAVAARAKELGLEVWQPRKVRTGDLADRLRALELDVAVVIAYGRILPREVLEAPRLGCINLHGSILPRWRGAAPIQWAVAAGDDETGVTLMQMDEGMDTGPILTIARTRIQKRETAGDVFVRLSALSAEVLRAELPRFLSGELVPEPQREDRATHARPLIKDDGALDFSRSAAALEAHLRGMTPWPGAFAYDGDTRIKIHDASALTLDAGDAEPGAVLGGDADGIRVATSEGVLAITELQLPGRKRLSAQQFMAGHALPERLSAAPAATQNAPE